MWFSLLRGKNNFFGNGERTASIVGHEEREQRLAGTYKGEMVLEGTNEIVINTLHGEDGCHIEGLVPVESARDDVVRGDTDGRGGREG